MISLYPKFYNAFKCKGDNCNNTCCQKWEIDIDADSVNRYKNMVGSLGDDVRAAMDITDGVYRFKFNEEQTCPLLQDGLCRIVLAHGEDALCEICHMHPRFFKYIGELELCGVGLSCEASCELLMGQGDIDINSIGITNVDTGFISSQNTSQNIEFIIPGIDEIYHLKDIVSELAIGLTAEDLRFEPMPSTEDYGMLFGIMNKMEALSSQWTDQLRFLLENPGMATEMTIKYWENCSQFMFHRLYQYILYRQLNMVSEYYADSLVAYARDSTEFILICSAVFGNPLIQAALWSEQIEYDEDNVKLLFTMYDEM